MPKQDIHIFCKLSHAAESPSCSESWCAAAEGGAWVIVKVTTESIVNKVGGSESPPGLTDITLTFLYTQCEENNVVSFFCF